jgi:ubiquinol-cytochrome c reductase iron-sulfur subunit
MRTVTELIRAIDEGTLPDADRRSLLVAATGIAAGAGLLAAAYPFAASLAPSEVVRAQGGPVLVDISTLATGELRTVAWRGKPVWLMRRSEDMVRALQQPNPALADPQSRRSEQPKSCANPTRSERPDILVAVGVCTHLGCSPTLRLDDSALNAELHAPGGFFCPCHGSRFDLAGRVVKNVPAPTNLDIPAYRFIDASRLQIGQAV